MRFVENSILSRALDLQMPFARSARGRLRSEGGSLFGGGVQVSDAEKETLGEISSALGV
jgi:hypothetical protein